MKFKVTVTETVVTTYAVDAEDEEDVYDLVHNEMSDAQLKQATKSREVEYRGTEIEEIGNGD